MSFGQAIASFFKNYANFKGRARRSEFWFVYLFLMIVAAGFGVLTGIASAVESDALTTIVAILMGLWDLAILIPTLALEVRRVHDIGNHWYCILLYLIPIADIVFLFIFNCTDSKGDNEFGPSPKYPGTM